jgi:serine/threonine protein kinase
MLYEVVTGRLPFEGANPMALFANITEGRCPRPRETDPTIAPELEAIVLRAMAKDPGKRFPSVHELGAALLPHVNDEDRSEWTRYFTTKNPNLEYSVPVRRDRSAYAPKAAGAHQARRREPTRASKKPRTSARDRRLIAGMVVTAMMALAAIVTVRGFVGKGAAPVLPAAATAGSRAP